MRRGLDRRPRRWLRDWDAMAARLVDAQAGGLARSVRGLGSMAGAIDAWPHLLLEGAARLHLLCEAYCRADELPAGLRADVRSLVGWTTKEDDLGDADAVSDRWLVVGRRLDEGIQVMTARTWLLGEASGRIGAAPGVRGGRGAADAHRAARPTFRATLAFYPSATPLRAVVRPVLDAGRRGGRPAARRGRFRRGAARAPRRAPGDEPVPGLVAGAARCRRADPVAGGGRGAPGRGRRVAAGRPGSTATRLLATSGGHPVAVFGEWDGSQLRPLSAFAEGRFVDLEPGEWASSPPRDGIATWPTLLSAALLGTERSGPLPGRRHERGGPARRARGHARAPAARGGSRRLRSTPRRSECVADRRRCAGARAPPTRDRRSSASPHACSPSCSSRSPPCWPSFSTCSAHPVDDCRTSDCPSCCTSGPAPRACAPPSLELNGARVRLAARRTRRGSRPRSGSAADPSAGTSRRHVRGADCSCAACGAPIPQAPATSWRRTSTISSGDDRVGADPGTGGRAVACGRAAARACARRLAQGRPACCRRAPRADPRLAPRRRARGHRSPARARPGPRPAAPHGHPAGSRPRARGPRVRRPPVRRPRRTGRAPAPARRPRSAGALDGVARSAPGGAARARARNRGGPAAGRGLARCDPPLRRRGLGRGAADDRGSWRIRRGRSRPRARRAPRAEAAAVVTRVAERVDLRLLAESGGAGAASVAGRPRRCHPRGPGSSPGRPVSRPRHLPAVPRGGRGHPAGARR